MKKKNSAIYLVKKIYERKGANFQPFYSPLLEIYIRLNPRLLVQTVITAPRHITTKTQEPDLQRQLHAPPRTDNGSWNSQTRRRRFSTPRLNLSHTRCQDGLVVHRSTWPENMVVIQHHMHHLGFWLLLHVPVNRSV